MAVTNLTDAINKVSKEEARRANEELLPPRSVRQTRSRLQARLLFHPHRTLVQTEATEWNQAAAPNFTLRGTLPKEHVE
ncbi:hypothetical protein PIB30_034117 [Stylosanthes scabra]|uniref:Uncharacterized protein n=1 Tax=Stylosanthes scabra TaxID=79078 RepID=A0ABU6SE61_9FABA|nr:hypothetical protein [Stylosanthes scabra]